MAFVVACCAACFVATAVVVVVVVSAELWPEIHSRTKSQSLISALPPPLLPAAVRTYLHVE